jgi:hypothetical protein
MHLIGELTRDLYGVIGRIVVKHHDLVGPRGALQTIGDVLSLILRYDYY